MDLVSINVRAVTVDDAKAWAALYGGYRAFYALPEDPAAVTRTWQWVLNGEHGLTGLVATANEIPVGLANLRWFARPSTAAMALYLDDLYTAPDMRARGVGRALLDAAAELAARDGASIVRWITAADNADARRLYDSVAQETPWVTYDMSPR